MSLTVKHLNGDATFLLTFAPQFAPTNSDRRFPGSITILFDPWLEGESVIYHPKFASSRHCAPPAIKSLAELKDVDLIIISQEKADHLSKETLCTLPKNTDVTILANSSAAKKIRGWRHFQNPNIVQEIKTYQDGKEDTILRVPIEPYSSASADGEITITNISEKGDVTKLHNAICVTYCPPGSLLTSWDGKNVKLDTMPAIKSTPGRKQDKHAATSPRKPNHQDIRGRPQQRNLGRSTTQDLTALPPLTPPSRVDSAHTRPSTSGSRAPTVPTLTHRPPNHENVISVVFAPHGLSPEPLKPYITNHLADLKNALPVTALFHCLTTEANPWWLGGVVCKGAPGGVDLAREVEVNYWISAHDGEKELKGWATKRTKSQTYEVQDVTRMLREREGVGGGRARGTEVCVLGCGETRIFR